MVRSTRTWSRTLWTDIFRNLTGVVAKQAAKKLGRRLTPQTCNRPNATLVDTDGKGVQQLTERAVVVGGRQLGG